MSNQVSDLRVLTSQILASSIKNILFAVVGMAAGYPTILIPALLNENNANFILTNSEISWIASLQFICTTFGSIGSGAFAHYFGRKRLMQIITVPLSIAWAFVGVANQIWQVYVGFILNGICCGLVGSALTSYVPETAQPRIRGMLSAANSLSITIGTLIEVILGSFLSWRSTAFVSIVVLALVFISLCFVPESPHWLIKHNKLNKAKKSIAWLRGWTNVNEIEVEFQNLHRDLSVAGGNDYIDKKKIYESYLNKNFYWPFTLVSFVGFISTFSGLTSLSTYSVNIFNTLQVPMDEYYATILLQVLQLVGCVVSLVLVKYLGKRIMTFASTLALAVFECVLGFYVYFKNINHIDFYEDEKLFLNVDEINWIPLTVLVLLVFVGNCGLRILPWILASEVFTYDTRAVGIGLFSALYYVFYFLTNKIFLDMIELLSFPGLLCFYSCLNIFGFIVFYYTVPETEGKSLQEITNHFSGITKLDNNTKKYSQEKTVQKF